MKVSEKRGTRRTPEQIAADLDLTIDRLQNSIAEIEEKKAASIASYDEKIKTVRLRIKKLEDRKKELLSPKKRKPRKSKTAQIKELIKQANKAGLKLEDIAEKLGVPLAEE